MMSVKSYCTLLAKVGHKISGTEEEQADILYKEYYEPDINKYTMKRLSTIHDILNNNDINDLVVLDETRTFSLDYDYKRKPIDEHNTMPHETMEDFLRYRNCAQNIREKKKIRATPELVNQYQHRSKNNVRKRGSDKQDCIRHFLRALLQDVTPFKKVHTYVELAQKLAHYGVSMNNLKNANRKPFVANVIFNNSCNRRLIRKMLKTLNVQSDNNYQEYLDILICPSISNAATIFK